MAAGVRDDTRALPAWVHRMPAAAQRTYLRSDAIPRFGFSATSAASAAVARLIEALERDSPVLTQHAAEGVALEVCRLAAVPPLAIEVRAVRPRNARGELHGLFYPADLRRRTAPRIILWMRTAVHHDTVKPRTFVRTLMHELVHYLDYSHLQLGNSFHTAGFFKRESYLVRALFPEPPPARHPVA